MSRSIPVKLAYDLFVPFRDEDVALSPVILLHGMTSSRATWLSIPQNIADGTKRKEVTASLQDVTRMSYSQAFAITLSSVEMCVTNKILWTPRRVYALDARNHGESEWSEEFNYDIMAKDVEKFMHDAHISKAVVVGHSMGGKTAMTLALSKPEKVEKLVIEDISPKVLAPSARRFPFHYLKLMRQSLAELPEDCDLEIAGEIIANFIRSHTPEEHRSKVKIQNLNKTLPLKMTEKGVAWQTNIDVIENAFLNNPRLGRELDGFYNGEVLFIYGTKSIYGVYNAKDKILPLFPKAVFSAVEDATHLVHLEFPEEFCKKVVDFIGLK